MNLIPSSRCPGAVLLLIPKAWLHQQSQSNFQRGQSVGSNPTAPCHPISPKLTIPFPSAPDERSKAENTRPIPTCNLLQVPPSFLCRPTWSWHGQWGHHELVGKEMLRSWHHPHTRCSVGHPWDHRMGTPAQGSCDAHRAGHPARRTRWSGRGQHDKTAVHFEPLDFTSVEEGDMKGRAGKG